MLCPPASNVEKDEFVVGRFQDASPNGDGHAPSQSGSLTWRESFLRVPQPGAPQPGAPHSDSDGQTPQHRKPAAKVYTASERQLMGLIITERQERSNAEHALGQALERGLAKEQSERQKVFEEIWKKVEEAQVQQMLDRGSHHGHRHGSTSKEPGKEKSEQIARLSDMVTSTGKALGMLMEALLDHYEAVKRTMAPSEHPQVIESIQTFHQRIVGIMGSWGELSEVQSAQIQSEVMPEQFSARIVAVEKSVKALDLHALERKLEDKNSELKCQLAAMEEDLRDMAAKGVQMGPAVNQAAASDKSEGTPGDRRSLTVPNPASPAASGDQPDLRRMSSFSAKVLDELRKKLQLLEERQDVQSKEIMTALALRGDVVKLVANAPLQALRSHRSALRCVELSPEKRLEMLKALDAKEEQLKHDMAKVKERHAALGLTHLYADGAEVDRHLDDMVPPRAKSRGSSVTPLTDIE